jgi:hypothetical protein
MVYPAIVILAKSPMSVAAEPTNDETQMCFCHPFGKLRAGSE